MSDQINKQLLRRYLDNDCTALERTRVEAFLKLPGSLALFEEVLDEYWAEVNTGAVPDYETNHYAKFKNNYLAVAGDQKKLALPFLAYLKYAAVLLLGLTTGIYFFKLYQTKQASPIAYIYKHNPRGQRSIVTLPDSSIVYLGPGSNLSFNPDFKGPTREVNLDGEAFFSVKHHARQAFVVRSKGVKTIVLGTSFKIEAFRPNTISVSVATGKVGVGKVSKASSYQSLAVLVAGQRAVYNSKTQKVTMDKVIIDDLMTWKDGGMVFRDMTLSEICERLERWYNIRIMIDHGMENFKLSATFDKVNINEILEIITRTAGMKYTVNNHLIHLHKKPL